MAALLHLFFMAAFSWMLVEGLLLWSKVVAVNLNEDRHMKYYYLIGWGRTAAGRRENHNSPPSGLFSPLFDFCLSCGAAGLPVLIVTITLASASGKYSADGYCWLSVQDGVIWGFAGPVIFIIMVRELNTHSCWSSTFCSLLFLMSSQPIIIFSSIMTSNSSK